MEIEVSTEHTFRFVCTFDEALEVAAWVRKNLNMGYVKELRFSFDSSTAKLSIFNKNNIEHKSNVTVILTDAADAAKFKMFQESL